MKKRILSVLIVSLSCVALILCSGSRSEMHMKGATVDKDLVMLKPASLSEKVSAPKKECEKMNRKTKNTSVSDQTKNIDKSRNLQRKTGKSTSEQKNVHSTAITNKPVHTHNWVPIYTVVRHPAQYRTIYHDAVYQEAQQCKSCSALNPDDAHAETHALNGENSGTYSVMIKVSDAWTETVLEVEEWSEQVIDCYKCNECGIVK